MLLMLTGTHVHAGHLPIIAHASHPRHTHTTHVDRTIPAPHPGGAEAEEYLEANMGAGAVVRVQRRWIGIRCDRRTNAGVHPFAVGQVPDVARRIGS